MSPELHIIGSNSAAFAHHRHHTSQLLSVQNQFFLIDCGEGTQLLLKKYKTRLSRIDHILISHLHGDHYFGLIGLLSTMHLFGRDKNLHLIAPPGLAEIITLQLRHSETWLSYKINFIEWAPGISEEIYENQSLTITTIPMDHRVPCSGFLFREKPKKRRINRKSLLDVAPSYLEIERLKEGDDILNADGSVRLENRLVTLAPNPRVSYAYCSDTRYNTEIVDLVSGVDLLYHESTFMEKMKRRARDTYHSTAAQAADIARKAEVKRLILGHFSTRYKELEPLLAEARAVFPNTELALEGVKFNIHGRQ